MKTFQPTQKEVKRSWHLIDAKGQTLGRLASKIAMILMGKQKANYSAHMDSGDYVVVVNAAGIKVTGRKESQKVYRRHSGYPGGFRVTSYAQMMEEKPTEIIKHAVTGMLPDNRIKRDRLARFKVFAKETHPYKAKFSDKKE